MYESNKYVKAAVIGKLNLLVPSAYRKVTGGDVGTQMYQTTDDPREIIRKLRQLYGQLSPKERKTMDSKRSTPWNTAMPIEHYFKGLEEMFILATKYPLEFTMGQSVKNVLELNKRTSFDSEIRDRIGDLVSLPENEYAAWTNSIMAILVANKQVTQNLKTYLAEWFTWG